MIFGSTPFRAEAAPGFGVLNLDTGEVQFAELAPGPNTSGGMISHLTRIKDGFVGSFYSTAGSTAGSTALKENASSGLAMYRPANAEKIDFALRPKTSGYSTEVLSLAYDAVADELWFTAPGEHLIEIWSPEKNRPISAISSTALKSDRQPNGPVSTTREVMPNGIAHDPKRDRTYVVTFETVAVLETSTRTLLKSVAKPRDGYAAHSRLV
mgnify:CR=1 FL=1